MVLRNMNFDQHMIANILNFSGGLHSDSRMLRDLSIKSLPS